MKSSYDKTGQPLSQSSFLLAIFALDAGIRRARLENFQPIDHEFSADLWVMFCEANPILSAVAGGIQNHIIIHT